MSARTMNGSLRVSPVRVGLAVGHDFMRSAVGVVLAQSAVLELVGECSDAASALDLVACGNLDVLVLDRTLPDAAVPASIRRILLAAPGTRIVVVAMADDPRFASEAIGAGASGYVLKDAIDAELVDAVRAAAQGNSFISSRLAERMHARVRADPRPLSEPQIAMLRLVARGHGSETSGASWGSQMRRSRRPAPQYFAGWGWRRALSWLATQSGTGA